MPKVFFRGADGASSEVEAKSGYTLMEVAVDNNIEGVVAECGGACACATCHVYVDDAWVPRLPAVDDMEDAMLDSAQDRRSGSRLSCQIELDDSLDGLVITVADNAG
jgi:2Fe-2S ferredoxin